MLTFGFASLQGHGHAMNCVKEALPLEPFLALP